MGELVRAALAAIVWWLPGLVLAGRLGGASWDSLTRAALGGLAAAGLSTLLAFLLQVLGLDPRAVGYVLLGLAVLSALVLLRGLSRPAPTREDLIGGLLALGLVVSGAILGGSMRYLGDGPDHVGTLREILASGTAFPTEAFYRDAGILGSDARKGLLHPVLASLSSLVGLDPAGFWRLWAMAAAPMAFLAPHAFLRLAGAGRGTALAGGAAALLTWSGGVGRDLVPLSVYPNQFGAMLFWIAAGVALRVKDARSALLAGAGLAIPVFVHPMYLVFAALYGGLLFLAALLRHRDRLRFIVLAGGAAGALLLPYLLYRLASYAPANPIHTELQGMLLWSPDRFTADPIRLWSSVGLLGLVSYPLLLAVAWRRRRHALVWPLAFLAVLTMLNFTLNPWLVPFLQEHITYLIFRSFWLLPPAMAAGLVWAGRHHLPGPWRRVAGPALLVALLPGLLALARSPGAESRFDSGLWESDLRTLDALLPDRSVILSDPVTSYLIPAFTGHKVVTAFDQHSPPNDARGRERLLAVRDVLSPVVDDSTAWERARGQGADFVLLNPGLEPGLNTMFWTFSPSALETRARQLDASPRFEPLDSGSDLLLYAVSSSGGPPSGVASPWVAVPEGPVVYEGEGVRLLAVEIAPMQARPRDRVSVHLTWERGKELEAGGRIVSVRFDHVEKPGRGEALSKLRRKVMERIEGVRYRFRGDSQLGGGVAPPELWPGGLALQQTVEVVVPPDVEPGLYQISVAVNRFPQMPNHRLADYVSDRDLYSGTSVGSVTIYSE